MEFYGKFFRGFVARITSAYHATLLFTNVRIVYFYSYSRCNICVASNKWSKINLPEVVDCGWRFTKCLSTFVWRLIYFYLTFLYDSVMELNCTAVNGLNYRMQNFTKVVVIEFWKGKAIIVRAFDVFTEYLTIPLPIISWLINL